MYGIYAHEMLSSIRFFTSAANSLLSTRARLRFERSEISTLPSPSKSPGIPSAGTEGISETTGEGLAGTEGSAEAAEV